VNPGNEGSTFLRNAGNSTHNDAASERTPGAVLCWCFCSRHWMVEEGLHGGGQFILYLGWVIGIHRKLIRPLIRPSFYRIRMCFWRVIASCQFCKYELGRSLCCDRLVVFNLIRRALPFVARMIRINTVLNKIVKNCVLFDKLLN